MTENQNPEQKARDNIDALLQQAGWVVQSAKKIDLNAGLGIAVREYQTDVGPADYALFVDKKALGIVEAKKEDLAHKITEVEEQTGGYAAARLKWVNNKEPLPFLYESTGIITRFTDGRDPKPRSREVFNFHRPETLKEWLSQDASLRERLHHIPPLNPNHLLPTHYVIVDAIGVTKSLKTASQPLITKPTVPLKDLAMQVMMGATDEDTVSALAGRLARLNKQLDADDQRMIRQAAGGLELKQLVGQLFGAIDADNIEARALQLAGLPIGTDPGDDKREQAQQQLVQEVASVLNGELVELLDTIRRDKEQTIDHDNIDSVLQAGWAKEAANNAQAIADEFAPLYVWQAYRGLDDYKGAQPVQELTALVTLIRRVCGMDETLTDFDATVRRNFRNWIMQHHSGGTEKFYEEQMDWLRMVRDHVAISFHIERDELEDPPFGQGGLGKMYQLFGAKMDTLLNEVLVA